MSNYKIEFTLRQHTPLIHFLHHQPEATLRGTEVKARLDKFLIGKGNIQKEWLIGFNTSGERNDALFYKVRISPVDDFAWRDYIEKPKKDDQGRFKQKVRNGITSTETTSHPSFFGNMGKNYEIPSSIKKFVFYPSGINVVITTFNEALKKEIEKHLPEFFATHNFGTRKTKGFGSFYFADTEKYKIQTESWFDYKVEIPFEKTEKESKGKLVDDYRGIYSGYSGQPGFFYWLDMFYRCLRGGINLKDNKDKTTFYFKSLLFLYYKSKEIQWEKRTIKENFFPKDWEKTTHSGKTIKVVGFLTQKANQKDSDALQFHSKDKKIVKDLLGLSSEESWLSYASTITKEHKKKEDSTDNKQIQRFASPIIFKPVEITPGTMTVFIRFDESNLHLMLGEEFEIKTQKGAALKPPLSTPQKFSLGDFFTFITNPANFNILTHVSPNFHNTKEFKELEKIFQSLTPLRKVVS